MKNILFTNVKSNGEVLDDGDNNVMVFTNLSPITLEKAFKIKGISWDECYEVPGNDLQFYLYQPLHLSKQEERRAQKLATKLTPA